MRKGGAIWIRPRDQGRRWLFAAAVLVIGTAVAVLAARLLPRGEFVAGPLMPAIVVTVTIVGGLRLGVAAAVISAVARLVLIDDPAFGVDEAADTLPTLYLLIGALLLAAATDRMELGRTRASTAAAHMLQLSEFEAKLAELDAVAGAPERIAALATAATGTRATLRPADRKAGAAVPTGPNPRWIRARRGGEWLLELADTPPDAATERFVDDVARQIGQTIERLTLLEAERQARAEEELMLTTSERLAQSLDVQETIDTLHSVFVPAIADSLMVTLGEAPPRQGGDGSIWSVELRSRDRLIGWLSLARTGRPIDAHARAVVGRLASLAAQALDNALIYDAQRRTRAILERSLLPHAILPVDHLQVATRYQPATAETDVGGDFYDAVRRPDGSIVLIIGDVQGKGVAAATLTAVARHTLRSAALEGARPAELLGHLNQALFYGHAEQAVAHTEENAGERFVTACVVALAPTPWGFEAVAACGGHPPPLVVRADTSTEYLNARGPLLGLIEAPVFREQKTDLRMADTIVLYTDGVTELRHGGEWFDDVGLGRLLHNRRAAVEAEAIAQLIHDTALLLSEGKPRDDIAILVASVRDVPNGTADRSGS